MNLYWFSTIGKYFYVASYCWTKYLALKKFGSGIKKEFNSLFELDTFSFSTSTVNVNNTTEIKWAKASQDILRENSFEVCYYFVKDLFFIEIQFYNSIEVNNICSFFLIQPDQITYFDFNFRSWCKSVLVGISK